MLSSRRTRGAAAGRTLLVASAVLLLAAACGDSGSDDGGDNASGNGQNALAAYAECMSENGVDLQLPSARADRSGEPGARPSGFPADATARPSGAGSRPSGAPSGGSSDRPGGRNGGGAPGGFSKPEGVDDATWEKAQQACQSVLPSGGPGGGGERDSAYTAYSTCLSDHGVTTEDGLRELSTADPAASTDAKLAAALKACEALRPTSTPTGNPPATAQGTPTPTS